MYVKLDLLPDRKEIEELRRAHITRQGKNSVVKHHDLFHSLAKEDSLSNPCILQRIEPYKTSLHYIVIKGKVMVFKGEAGVTVVTALWKVRVSTRSMYEIIMGRKSVGEVFRERESTTQMALRWLNKVEE